MAGSSAFPDRQATPTQALLWVTDGVSFYAVNVSPDRCSIRPECHQTRGAGAGDRVDRHDSASGRQTDRADQHPDPRHGWTHRMAAMLGVT